MLATRLARLRPVTAGVLTGVVVLAAALATLALVSERGNDALRDEVRRSLLRAASAGAAVIDVEVHRTFTSPDQEGSPAYAEAVARLERVLRSSPDLKFIYTCVLVDGDVYFVLDPTPAGDSDADGVDDKSHVMEAYPEANELMLQALRTGTPQADEEATADRWGTFMSAYAPFFDNSGATVGVVGVDLDVRDYLFRLREMHEATLIGAAIAAFLAVASGTGVFLLRRRITDNAALRQSAMNAAVSRLQAAFISQPDVRTAFEATLPDLLALSKSEHGFLAEVSVHVDDRRRTAIRATTSANWDASIAALLEEEERPAVEEGALEKLLGRVLATNQPAILGSTGTRLPHAGPRGGTGLRNIVVLPFRDGTDVVGIVGLAREAAHADDIGLVLQPLLAACASIVASARTDRERRAQQEALQRYALELAVARDEALEAARAKCAFLANMGHEIRTPMNGVLGMTQLLLDTELTEDQRGLAGIVRTSGEALLVILNDILDFSVMDAGGLRLEVTDFEPAALVSEVLDLLAAQASGKGIVLALEMQPALPSVLAGDRERLRQVLVNLVSNAIKFTETGRVAVHVHVEDWTGAAILARFEVRDTGPGIAPSDQQRLFDPFTQVDDSSTRRHGGTGLGLAICRELVRLMGGAIGVQSEIGQGSTFWFTARLGLGLTASAGTDSAHRQQRTAEPAAALGPPAC
jgi:signal transduction histidine kinase